MCILHFVDNCYCVLVQDYVVRRRQQKNGRRNKNRVGSNKTRKHDLFFTPKHLFLDFFGDVIRQKFILEALRPSTTNSATNIIGMCTDGWYVAQVKSRVHNDKLLASCINVITSTANSFLYIYA